METYYIITPKYKKILESERLLPVAELTYKALARNRQVTLYVGDGRHSPIHPSYFEHRLMFFVDVFFNDAPFGWIVNGQVFKILADPKSVQINFDSAIDTTRPLDVDKFLEGDPEKFHVYGKLLPEVVEALGVRVVDEHYRTRRDYGHERCWITWEVCGRRVMSWWTSCDGPGYSCSYDHPSGFEFAD